MKVSVIGLGKLGLPMAALFASKGYKVIGLDTNPKTIKLIQEGNCPIQETKLPKLLASVGSNLQVTTNYEEAITNTDITFIIVPTPSTKSGRFSNEFIMSVMKKIVLTLQRKKGYHLFVITSTVMPGTMEREIKPILENLSMKKCGEDFGLCYNPEFIALGSVLDDMRKPDAILIGESDSYAGQILKAFHEVICENNPPVVRMSWWNAEVAKLALNVFVTTKISLANTFTDICSKIPGGNVDDVTKFLGMDSRIGSKFLKGGLGFGGTCFPRDNRAFIKFTKELGLEAPIQRATDQFNNTHDYMIVDEAIKLLKNDGSIPASKLNNKIVSVLGITYKPQTNITEESSALKIALALARLGATVKVYDPAGKAEGKLISASSTRDCLQDSDLCVIAVPWKEFEGLSPEAFTVMRHPRILDCWRVLSRNPFEEEGIEYHALGVNS